MGKRVVSLLLSLLLLLSLSLPAAAAEKEKPEIRQIRIVNLKNLEKLAENCRLDSYSRHLVVSLEADLDLTGRDFSGIPIFCGTFRGNGHRISGLNMTRDGSAQGFFRYLTETAVVEDLHLEGTVQPEGSAGTVGGIVGENSGILRRCSFTGTVSGKEYIGGIAGVNKVTGILENCQVSGTVYGIHFVGGIAGKNAGTVRGSENRAQINETARKNEVELTDITMDSLLYSEAANTVTDVGGIAGNNTGMIRECVNQAPVGHASMGYNIGGIAGTQSGTILSCENRGEINGRKEVGGIAGQMEPSSVMTFEEDALQILTRQLDGLGQAVSKAGSNLEGAGEAILGQMEGVYGHILDAKDAAETLIPDLENMEFPDLDTIQAARNNIGSSLQAMSRQMQNVGAAAYSALGRVSTNLHAIQDQINAMRSTIDNISETLGGGVLDRSDEDTEQDLTGKVADCRNYGDIQGDRNIGGIAGAIALENDLDVQEDLLVTGESSLNFESELRAVILNCENSGRIAAKKQNVGGIVGLQSLGLVRSGRNSGVLDAKQADYVGGISGRSTGFIRSCYADSQIFGSTHVGGIAGSASVATDCRALVQIQAAAEKMGAVLGGLEENLSEVEDPIAGNIYLAPVQDPGAIDGISYDGQAQPVDREQFFREEDLPGMFRKVNVVFRYGNGTRRSFSLDFGDSFPEDWIPPIPPKEGRQSYWKGLEDADLSAVFFDMEFTQEYTSQLSVLESGMTRSGLPLLLLQGVFREDTQLHVEALAQPGTETGGVLLEAWQFQTGEPQKQNGLRLLLPENVDGENLRIRIRGADGTWREEDHHVQGRYGIVPLEPGDDAVALVQTKRIPWLLIAAVLGVSAAAAAFLLYRKRKKK